MLPKDVLEMLRHNSLIQLATCSNDVPSASLMNFTFIEPGQGFDPEGQDHLIVMASPPNTVKVNNVQANPNVSLLLHDWQAAAQESEGLAGFLQQVNRSALGQKSVTLNGTAKVLDGPEAEHYRKKHLDNNPEAACFITNSQIIIINTTGVKVADSRNHVKTFTP